MAAPHPREAGDGATVPGVARAVEVGGQVLRIDVRPGTANRVPLLVCNGIGVSLGVLDGFVAALDPGRTVIRFDAPGVGGSPGPRIPYRFPALARLVVSALDRLGYPVVDVLGYSWGGGLAQQIALQHPERCRRLVLVATATGSLMVPPADPRMLRGVLPGRRSGGRSRSAGIAGDVYGGSARDPGQAMEELLLLQRAGTSASGWFHQLAAAAGWTSIAFLPRVRQRTLILAGDDDPVIPPANGRLMAKLMPHATLSTYEGGHIELVAQPRRFAALVEPFLDA